MMVAHRITMIILQAPALTGSGGMKPYEPWSVGSASFTLPQAQVTSLVIGDDDGLFETTFYSKDEDQQRLLADAVIGSGNHAVTVPAGTMMSHFAGSIIRDGNGNQFIATFPRTTTQGAMGEIVGGKTAILITPVPVKDPATGDTVFPVFDPSETFRYVGAHVVGNSSAGIGYAPGVPCFAAGTMIDTLLGPRAVESLDPGDMILTRDSGFCPLLWVGGTHLDACRLDLHPNLRPILIRAGTLAPGVPARNLYVSPQHRILVRSTIAHNMFGEEEILVAARHLTSLPGIEVLNPALGVTYYHLLFDRHQIIRSNGAWSESLYTGPQAMRAVGDDARREILVLFPELLDPSFRPVGARKLLNGREGRKLAERHVQNHRDLMMDSR